MDDRKRKIRELLGEIKHRVKAPPPTYVLEVTVNVCGLECSKKVPLRVDSEISRQDS